MSTAVKVWLTILLLAMFVLTSATLWVVGRRQSAVEPSRGIADVDLAARPDKVVDLSAFEMTERSGAAVSFDQLRGQVWVASMFFSTCPHQCTNLNLAIAALQKDPALDGVRFVSISVDPATDTPQVLQETAKIFDADPDRWWFMHSDIPTIERFGKAIGVPAGYLTHVRSLVLIDRTGRVRGYFAFNDAEAIAKLKAIVPAVLAEPVASDAAAKG